MSSFTADIHEATFTTYKSIWTIETTVENLHKALAEVKTSLEVLPDMLDAEYLNKFEAFPALQVIPTYGTTYKYTEQITSNVSTAIHENEKKYTSPPSNAWSRGPPKATKHAEQNGQAQTNRTTQNYKLNDDYKSLKKSMEKSQKQQEKKLAKINKKLDQKMITTKDTIWSLVKEILWKELAEIHLDVITEILEEIKL
eukprot:13617364-Ditylum_brightwellii.AAC.1